MTTAVAILRIRRFKLCCVFSGQVSSIGGDFLNTILQHTIFVLVFVTNAGQTGTKFSTVRPYDYRSDRLKRNRRDFRGGLDVDSADKLLNEYLTIIGTPTRDQVLPEGNY